MDRSLSCRWQNPVMREHLTLIAIVPMNNQVALL